MRLTPVLAVVAIVGGAFYGKLLHDREVQQGLIKAHEDDKPTDPKDGDKTPPPPPSPTPTPISTPDPVRKPRKHDSDRTPVLSASDEEKLAEARSLVRQGRFEPAQDACSRVKGSADLELAATQLGEEAQLYATLTKAIQPHPFAGVTDLVQVTLASGIAHTARILREDATTVVLALADGRELEVRPERIAKREKLPAEAWSKQVRAEVEKKKNDLAADAGALEIYHVACEAFEVGATDMGAELLERSLGLDGGDAIIDVYGFGDLEVLHRAQHRIRKRALAANPGLVAEGRRPRTPRVRTPDSTPAPPPPPPPPAPSTGETPPPPPPPAPSTGETPPAPPPPPPAPEPEPPVSSNAMDTEKLESDGRWIDAHEAYKTGVDLYRAGFNGRTQMEKSKLKQARTSLEKARDLLDKLPTDMTSDAATNWDSFSARVNEILRAVKKQMAATGS